MHYSIDCAYLLLSVVVIRKEMWNLVLFNSDKAKECLELVVTAFGLIIEGKSYVGLMTSLFFGLWLIVPLLCFEIDSLDLLQVIRN